MSDEKMTAPIRTPHWRSLLGTVCLSLSLLLGLFFPTSIRGEISKGLGYLCSLILLGIYSGLTVSAGSLAGPSLLICSLTINASLLLASLLSDLSDLAFGAYAFYFLLSCLYVLDLRGLHPSRLLNRVFTVASVALLLLAAASLLGIDQVTSVFINSYCAFYPELVPSMFRLGKPVLMFGSHSLAGFFYYLFFLLNFLNYTRHKRVVNLALALCFLCTSLTLQSLTAYVYVIVGVLQVLVHFGVHRNVVVRLVTLALSACTACALVLNQEARGLIWSAIAPLFTSNINGLAARYTSVGTLATNIEYILDNPFRPVGVRYSQDLWFVDSGVVEYMLRGSLFLVAAIYVGLFLFLKKNLRLLAHCVLLYGVYIAFEVGFSNLIYLRTLYLMPFVIVFLNSGPEDKSIRSRGSPCALAVPPMEDAAT
jgi:hypothetical protein